MLSEEKLIFLYVGLWSGIKRTVLNKKYLIVIDAVAIDIDLDLELIFLARLMAISKVVGKCILVAKQGIDLL